MLGVLLQQEVLNASVLTEFGILCQCLEGQCEQILAVEGLTRLDEQGPNVKVSEHQDVIHSGNNTSPTIWSSAHPCV